MKARELQELIKISYEQVATKGRDSAMIYHAVVEMDGKYLEQKRKIALLEREIQTMRRHLAAFPAELRNQYNPIPDR